MRVLKAVAKADRSDKDWKMLTKRHSLLAYSDMDSDKE